AVQRPDIAGAGCAVSAGGVEEALYGLRGEARADGGRGGPCGDAGGIVAGAGAGVGEPGIAAGGGVEGTDAGGEGGRGEEEGVGMDALDLPVCGGDQVVVGSGERRAYSGQDLGDKGGAWGAGAVRGSVRFGR